MGTEYPKMYNYVNVLWTTFYYTTLFFKMQEAFRDKITKTQDLNSEQYWILALAGLWLCSDISGYMFAFWCICCFRWMSYPLFNSPSINASCDYFVIVLCFLKRSTTPQHILSFLFLSVEIKQMSLTVREYNSLH